ncbi:MAG: DUF2163 domain-containing protein [Kordiimonadaceae bacterium]|nr:DUF2163 domain-containing protein [Kordiimonadaceae bacterium]
MMSVSPELTAALDAEQMRFAWLIQLPADIYLTDYATDLVWNGNIYVSQGDILSLPSVVRERGIKLQSYSIKLSNVDLSDGDQTPLDKLSSGNFTGAPCGATVLLLNADDSIIDGISLYKGTFHTWTENETNTSSTMNITLTSPWSKPNLTAGRVTSNNNQEDLYDGDKFFQYAHRERTDIGWGGKR